MPHHLILAIVQPVQQWNVAIPGTSEISSTQSQCRILGSNMGPISPFIPPVYVNDNFLMTGDRDNMDTHSHAHAHHSVTVTHSRSHTPSHLRSSVSLDHEQYNNT